IEVMFYLLLPFLLWVLRKAGKLDWLVCVLIYVGAEVWRIGFELTGQLEIARQLPGQMSFFLTGMMLYALRLSGWRLHFTGVAGALLLAASLFFPEAGPVRAAGLGAFAVWLATGAVRLPDAARFGDLSYGIYIVHAPIIQLSLVMGIFAASAWIGAVTALAASVVVALCLWHLIERPSLRRDSAYVTLKH
ncbi:MAG: acyltransferase family protein, partial [Hyphomonadaceae bacterium]|nr:acyltransferase family protein [Hyphomonadaceae bacterium]